MNNPNKYIFDEIGLTAWHDAGYTGKLGLSATGEDVVTTPITRDWWQSPFSDEQGDDHAYKSAMVFHSFAPERKLVTLRPDNSRVGKETAFQDETIPYAIKNGVDTFFVSLRADTLPKSVDDMLETVPALSYFSSAGNYGEDSHNCRIDSRNIFGVGAYDLKAKEPAGYSSWSQNVDFCAPTNCYAQSANGQAWILFKGTSCAAPALAGMCACVNHFFIEKTGKLLNRWAMYEFLQDCAVDVGVKGKDLQTGWGLPILPKPESVDISKYAGCDNMKFKDTSGHWAEKAIEEITDAGIMNGFPDGTFRPDQPLTRAQMAQLCLNFEKYLMEELDNKHF